MSSGDAHGERQPTGHKALTSVLIVLFFAACVAPRLGRLGHPSLVSDDIGWLRMVKDPFDGPWYGWVYQPFNEHVSPLFLGWTWLLWHLAGCRLAAAPALLTAGSYLPFVACLILLRAVVKRELGSEATALAAVALFSLGTFVYDEAIYWYAASSFMWALALTLVAWLLAALARERGSRLAWAGSAAAATAAPCFSLIGLLAGPVAFLSGLAAPRPIDSTIRQRSTCALPLLGSFLYFLVRLPAPRHPAALGFLGRARLLTEFEVLQSIARAPFEVLAPALVGFYHHVPLPNLFGPDNVHALPGALVVLLTLGLVCAVGVGAFRQRSRAMLLIGLLLIYCSYALTLSFPFHDAYCFRLTVERYHLFPHLGMVVLLTTAAFPLLRRLDSSGFGPAAAALGLAGLLVVTHPSIIRRTRHYKAPDQVRTLAAYDRLDEICRQQGITRFQARAALDPVSRRTWFPHDALGRHNMLQLLGTQVKTEKLPASAVRATLLAGLTSAQLAAVLGGSDMTAHVNPPPSDLPTVDGEDGEPVGGFLVDRKEDLVVARGTTPDRRMPSFLEFRFPVKDGAGVARQLVLPWECVAGDAAGTPIELWWSGDQGAWTVYRSVHWLVRPGQHGWTIPLDRIPHWDPASVRRIRLIFRTPVAIRLQPPRLVR